MSKQDKWIARINEAEKALSTLDRAIAGYQEKLKEEKDPLKHAKLAKLLLDASLARGTIRKKIDKAISLLGA